MERKPANRSKSVLRYAVLLVVAALTLAGLGGTAYAQTISPSMAVRAFLEAINGDDIEMMLATVDPDGEYISGPGAPDEYRDTLRGFLEGIVEQDFVVTIRSVSDTGPDTAVAEYEVAGGDIPPLPHPFSFVGTFTVKEGKVVKMVEEYTEQTAEDLAAFEASQLGMPKTGEELGSLMMLLGATGALALAGGALMIIAGRKRDRLA